MTEMHKKKKDYHLINSLNTRKGNYWPVLR